MDLIAIYQIKRTIKEGTTNADGTTNTAPRVETIQPGQAFTAEEDQAKELIDMKAARERRDGDPVVTGTNTQTDSTAAVEQQMERSAGGDDLEALRAEYEEVFGEAPNARMKPETMRARIDEKLAEGETEDMV